MEHHTPRARSGEIWPTQSPSMRISLLTYTLPIPRYLHSTPRKNDHLAPNILVNQPPNVKLDLKYCLLILMVLMCPITLTDGFGLCPKIVKSISSISSKVPNMQTNLHIWSISCHFIYLSLLSRHTQIFLVVGFMPNIFFLQSGVALYCFRNWDSWVIPGIAGWLTVPGYWWSDRPRQTSLSIHHGSHSNWNNWAGRHD